MSSKVESEAAALVEAVRMQDPDGPYHLFGYGFGAVLAFEMAHRLRDAGSRVRYLALTGSRAPSLNGKADDWMRSLSRIFALGQARGARRFKRAIGGNLACQRVERISHATAKRPLLHHNRDKHGARPRSSLASVCSRRSYDSIELRSRSDADPAHVKVLAGILREYAKTSFN